MQNFYNSVKSGGLKVCELLTPVLRESKFQVSSLHFRILLIKVSDSYGSALWENLIQAVKIAEKKVFYKNYPDFCVSSFVYLYWWKSITAYSDENNNKGTFLLLIRIPTGMTEKNYYYVVHIYLSICRYPHTIYQYVHPVWIFLIEDCRLLEQIVAKLDLSLTLLLSFAGNWCPHSRGVCRCRGSLGMYPPPPPPLYQRIIFLSLYPSFNK